MPASLPKIKVPKRAPNGEVPQTAVAAAGGQRRQSAGSLLFESRTSIRASSFGPLPSLLNHFCDSVEPLLRKLRPLRAQERGNHVLHGSVVERVHKLLQRGAANFLLLYNRNIDVAKGLLFVPDVTLAFENAQLRSDCGVVRVAGEIVHYLGGRCTAPCVQNVHDV